MEPKNPVYSIVKDLEETRNIKRVAELLSSGDWIAIDATKEENPLFVLGKVNQ